jgi:phospholipid transport system substrate-binding protein
MKFFIRLTALRISQCLVLALMIVSLTSRVEAMTSPDLVVKQTVDSLVQKIQSNRDLYKEDPAALDQMIEETLIPVIHVDRMARLILGKYSRQASADEIASFATEFKTFLKRSYGAALLDYTGDEKVSYQQLNAKPGADKVVIRADLISSDGQTYPVKLFMSNRKDDRWRAYNMEVVGINLVSTYRSTFGETAARIGVSGLTEELRKKNKTLGG